jgi:RNA 2',3'-cyclic 3'-phosphodiesterase
MRAFLAFRIPQEVKTYLQTVIRTMARHTDGVKWVNENGQHMTLKFFGEIEEERAALFQEALSGLDERYDPFSVMLGEVGAFPTRKRARVIIVTLKKGIDNIRMIFNDIEEKLSELEVEREGREFTPHITLGRRRVPAPLLEKDTVVIDQKTFMLDTLVLYRSTLAKEGAIYDPVWEIRLGGNTT